MLDDETSDDGFPEINDLVQLSLEHPVRLAGYTHASEIDSNNFADHLPEATDPTPKNTQITAKINNINLIISPSPKQPQADQIIGNAAIKVRDSRGRVETHVSVTTEDAIPIGSGYLEHMTPTRPSMMSTEKMMQSSIGMQSKL